MMLRVGSLNGRGACEAASLQAVNNAAGVAAPAKDVFVAEGRSPARTAWRQVAELCKGATPPELVVLDEPAFAVAIRRDWLQRDYVSAATCVWNPSPPLHKRVWAALIGHKRAGPAMDSPFVAYCASGRRVIVRGDRDSLSRDEFFLPMLQAAVHARFPEYIEAVASAFQEARQDRQEAAMLPPLMETVVTCVGSEVQTHIVDANQGRREQFEHRAELAQRRAWARLAWLEAVALVLAQADKHPGNANKRAEERWIPEEILRAAHSALHDGDVAVTFEHPELVNALGYRYSKVPLRAAYGQRECVMENVCAIACKALPDTFPMPGFEVVEDGINAPANPKREPLRAARQLLAAGPSRRGLSIVSQYVDTHPHSVEGLLLWADTIRQHMPYPDAARKMYEKVLTIEADNPAALEGLRKLKQAQAQTGGAR